MGYLLARRRLCGRIPVDVAVTSAPWKVVLTALSYTDQICAELAKLPEPNRMALLRSLREARGRGVVRRWCTSVGTLTDEDASEMTAAIEEAFETVDRAEW